jgi:hypothetical protein
MLITFVQERSETAVPLTIDVSEDRAEEVIKLLAMVGWHLLSKMICAQPSSVVDALQIALLEVSALPHGTPIRVAVEVGASAAIVGPPSLLNPQSAPDLVRSRQPPVTAF